jgi:hypothetical protein
MVSGRTRRRSLIQLASAAALGALVPERRAAAAPLSEDDRARLERGEVVRELLDLELPQGDYKGGVSYALIPAPVEDVMAVLHDPGTYTSILPLTLEARVLSPRGRDARVFFRQGTRLGSAGYVLLVRRESAGLIRFWLDPSEPHEIADCWGYFRVRPHGKQASVLTYAALIRLDPGLVKLLFSEKIRGYALSTPGVVRAYVMSHHAP